MPCNSDYMEANGLEVELSKVACLLDELDGKPFDRSHWRGYHPLVYNRGLSKRDADRLVKRLCTRLLAIEASAPDAELSLEMQMWWRDHQEADRARIQQEKDAEARALVKAKALAKLTQEEKDALDL